MRNTSQSAVTAALSGAGLPADRYAFLGFLPRKGGERDLLLRTAATSPVTVVLFEAANRLADLLADLAQAAGADRQAVVARELTKRHEEFQAGTLSELQGYYASQPPRGEVTVVVAGAGAAPEPEAAEADLRDAAQRLLEQGVSRRDAARQLADAFGIPRNAAYALVTSL